MKLIDGDNARSHWRLSTGGAEIWRCPKCHARGDGDQAGTVEYRPHRFIGRGGRKMRSPKIEVCHNCLMKGILTEV